MEQRKKENGKSMAVSPVFGEEAWRRLRFARAQWCVFLWHSAVLGSWF